MPNRWSPGERTEAGGITHNIITNQYHISVSHIAHTTSHSHPLIKYIGSRSLSQLGLPKFLPNCQFRSLDVKTKSNKREVGKNVGIFNINVKKLSPLCECERAERGREGLWCEGGGRGGDTTPTPSYVSQSCPGSQLLRSCGAGRCYDRERSGGVITILWRHESHQDFISPPHCLPGFITG